MRISDWSSDVCSSDLLIATRDVRDLHRVVVHDVGEVIGGEPVRLEDHEVVEGRVLDLDRTAEQIVHDRRADRKSVVEGKSVSVRVDLGGRRIIKKKKHTTQLKYKYK